MSHFTRRLFLTYLQWFICIMAIFFVFPGSGFGLEVIRQTGSVPHRGVYEIEIKAKEDFENPFFDVSLKVQLFNNKWTNKCLIVKPPDTN